MIKTFSLADESFPLLAEIGRFYTPRSKVITVWSLGLRTGGVEATLIEKVGCGVKIFDCRPTSLDTYGTVNRVLKNRAVEATDPSWCTSLLQTQVSPNSLFFHRELPWSFSGTLDISGHTLKCTAMNTQTTPKVDFCKIDYPEIDCHLVYQILQKGYRPGLFLIHWTKSPDENTETMLAAGHLQTCGYRLLGIENGYYLYFFIDECMYEMCSWLRTDTPNPMFDEFKKGFLEYFKIHTKTEEK